MATKVKTKITRRQGADTIRAELGPGRARRLDEESNRPEAERRPIVADLPLGLISCGVRVRQRLRNLDVLAADIAENGLLEGIGVQPDGTLRYGARRLLAMSIHADQYGWTTIRCNIKLSSDPRGDEAAENTMRDEGTPEERCAWIKCVLLPPLQERAARRKRAGKRASGNLPEGQTGEALTDAAKLGGLSRHTFERAVAVIDAAKNDPARFGHLREEMNETGKVDPAYTKLRTQQRQEEVLNVTPPKGRYRTIVIDPPWPMRKYARTGGEDPAWEYPTMTIEEIEDKIAEILESAADPDGCYVFLWTVQTFMPEAFEIFGNLGLTWGSRLLSWEKVNEKGGPCFSNPASTFNPMLEFVLFGWVGDRPVMKKIGEPTHFKGLRREHSRKPDEFYRMVERVTPGPYLDAFGRGERPGWTVWGDQAGLFDQAKAA